MKREITCIQNRLKWSKDLFKQLDKICKRTKDDELSGVRYDLQFHIGQIEYYVKKIQKEGKWKKK